MSRTTESFRSIWNRIWSRHLSSALYFGVPQGLGVTLFAYVFTQDPIRLFWCLVASLIILCGFNAGIGILGAFWANEVGWAGGDE